MQGVVDRLNKDSQTLVMKTEKLTSGKCDKAAFKEFEAAAEM